MSMDRYFSVTVIRLEPTYPMENSDSTVNSCKGRADIFHRETKTSNSFVKTGADYWDSRLPDATPDTTCNARVLNRESSLSIL